MLGFVTSTFSPSCSRPARNSWSVPGMASAKASKPTSVRLPRNSGLVTAMVISGPAKKTLAWVPVPRQSNHSQFMPASGIG